MLVAAGDKPERLRSEASFAHLCGMAPLPARSRKTVRHRLSRVGGRQANRAPFLTLLVRTYRDKETKAYVALVRQCGDGSESNPPRTARRAP
ncbi:MAG: hypothetical protein DLM66_04095 [Candidatus Dormiibacter spiritus]|nr:MAG: hypothetical protein DLM66_04095 [Candidatus Dormibacteraeota bacterium]